MNTRKPPDERMRQNRPQELQVVRAIAVEAPSPPPGMLKAQRDSWARFWSSDLARLVDSADLPAAERLWRLYDEADRLRRKFADVGRFQLGSVGQPQPSAPYKAWLAVLKLIPPLEDRFGVSPRGRLHLGVKLGDAVASLDRLNELWSAAGDDVEVVDID